MDSAPPRQDSSDSRKSHWETVYARKSSQELSWYSPHLHHSLSLIRRAALSEDSFLIDVGAGDSTLVDDLLDHGYALITLLDISSQALERTKLRLKQRSASIEWIVGDITRTELKRTYNLWHDRAVFHFLTPREDRTRYLEKLRQALIPGGFVVMATFAPEGPEKCSGLSTMRYSPQSLLGELGPSFQLMETLGDIHITPGGRSQDFIYCLFRHQSGKNQSARR